MPSLYSEIVTGGKDTTSAARPPGGFIPLSEVGEVSLTLIDEDCDDLLRRSTIQLHLSGRHALLTRREAIVAVLIASGVPKAEIIGLWKGENPRLVNVTFTRPEFVPTVLEASPMTLPQGVTAHVEHADCAVVEIRIHWVPLYIQNSLITRSFEQIGRVKEIQTERDEDGSDKGTRYLKLEIQRKNMGKIPTTFTVPELTLKMLVTVKGRASTCLVCGRPGHTRRDCPDVRKQYRPATGPTGHSKTTPRRDDKEPSTAPTLTVLGRVKAKPAPRTQSPVDQPWESTKDLRPRRPSRAAPPHPPPPPPLTPSKTSYSQESPTARPQEAPSTQLPRGSVPKRTYIDNVTTNTEPSKRSKETRQRPDDDALLTDDDDTMWQ
ncbi:hypothetical protein C0Q70_19392 [Pomacea canaliculata]|uniref:CCHC-type domain-containing protein n=1 Tax=Pomacea canaliculata TaxID=400727 RepID=A0A2T7NJ77_POMCA|nr:hypothetical protein C0Q70_19392 [Pomacea canaliculata]